MHRGRFYFFLIFSILMSISIVLGMFANVKAVALTHDIQEYSQELSDLKKENRELELKILRQTRPESLHDRAFLELSLSEPKKIRYFTQKDIHDSKKD